MLRNNQGGFTIIEMLVVVAIIGILSTLSIMSLNSRKSDARDVKRLGDLDTMTKALALYYTANGSYPPIQQAFGYSTGGYNWNGSATAPALYPLKYYLGPYLATGFLPTDPSSDTAYRYYYGSNPGDGYQSYGMMMRPETAKYKTMAANDKGYSSYSGYYEVGSQPSYCAQNSAYSGVGKNWYFYLNASGCTVIENAKCCGGN
jgi:prepilin-type N-terminal cleavage/methylation domain-containing protein